jgi:hypothetical protein
VRDTRIFVGSIVAAVLAVAGVQGRAEEIGPKCFGVVEDGQAVATIVAPAEDAPIWTDAIRLIAGTAERWGGTAPQVVRLSKDAPLPAGNLIVLGTPETLASIAKLTDVTESAVSRVPMVDEQGFAIESRTGEGVRHLVIVGKTPRGAYNGAVLCHDFLLDATPGPAGKANVFVRTASIVRSPQMQARGTYLLSIYGVAMKYTAEDWMKIMDSFAGDGMERVYFWLSGHHPSKKYPQLYDVDATKGTKLTVDGVKQLIRYCHDRGIKFYIGGGVFAWCASHYLSDGHPEILAVKAGGLCPSKPYARTGDREHFLEMFDTWSDADGFFLEIRDEHGECQCPDCQVRVDEFGSKGYGKAEITWLQEFAREAWKRNPKLHFSWGIGYAEHANDVYYYDQIRRMNDPRFEWLDARVGLDGNGKWVLPGPGGEKRPFPFFSHRIIHWDPFYTNRIEHIIHWARRVADDGLYGYVPAFEPGFATASYYYDEIPMPADILPYCLTGFVYREATWDPSLTMEQVKDRIHRRYFSPDAPKRFADDMIYLRQFSLDYARAICSFAKQGFGYAGERIPPLTIAGELGRVQTIADKAQRKAQADQLAATLKKLSEVAEQLKHMEQIEAAVDEAGKTATPKTLEGIAIMRRMIADTRAMYKQAVPDPAVLTAAIQKGLADAADGKPVPEPGREGFKVIRPAPAQDGPIYGSNVEPACPLAYWGVYNGGRGCAVGIHTLPPGIAAADVQQAILRIPQTDNARTPDTDTALGLKMLVKHIAAADNATITAADGQSAALAEVGVYRAPGPYVEDNARFVELDVTAQVRADVAAKRPTFAWRVEPQSVPAGATSMRYFPTVDNQDAAFGDNHGAKLFLRLRS